MQIEEISLANWLSYPEHWMIHGERKAPTLRFADEPVYLIFGRNGSGKSSIMDAILFALFGEYSRSQNLDGKRAQDIKMGDAIRDGEKTATVRLTFCLDGDRHRIIRQLAKGAMASHELWDPKKNKWVTRASGAEDVSNHVKSLLGMDSKLFRATVMLEQGKTNRFMEMDAKEQVQYITQLIGFTSYDAYYAKAKELANQRKAEMSRLEKDLVELQDASPERVADLQDQLKHLDAELEVLDRELDALKTLEEQVRAIADLRREIDTLSTQINEHKETMELGPHIRSAVKIVDGWTRLAPHLDALRGSRARAKAAEDEIARLEGQHEREQTRQAEKVDESARLEPIHKQAEVDLNATEQTLSAKRQEYSQAKEHARMAQDEITKDHQVEIINKAQEERAKKLDDFQKVESNHKLYSELNEVVPRFKTILKMLEKSSEFLEGVETREQELEKRAKEIADQHESIQQKQRAQEQAEADVETARGQVESLKSELDQAEALLENRRQAHGKAECPTCGTPLQGKNLDRFHRELQALEAKVEMLQTQWHTGQTHWRDLEKETKRKRQKLDALNQETLEAANELKRDRAEFKRRVQDAKKDEREARQDWQNLIQENTRAKDLLTTSTQECYDAIVKQRQLLKRYADRYDELKQTRADFNAAKNQLKQIERDRQLPAGTFRQEDLKQAQVAEKNLAAAIKDSEQDVAKRRTAERKMGRELDEARNASAEAARQIERIEKIELPAANSRREDALGEERGALIQLNDILKEIEWDKSDVEVVQRGIAGDEKAVAAFKSHVEQQRPLAKQLAALQKAERAIEGLLGKREGLENRLDRYPEDAQQSKQENVERDLEKKRQEIRNLQEKQRELNRGLWQEQQRLDAKTKKEGRLRTLQGEYDGLRQLESLLAPPGRDSDGGPLRQHILRGTLEQIATSASRILDDLGQAIGVTVPTERLAFRMVDRTSSNAERHFRLFSGGEKFMVALATALAVGELASQTGHPECLFIDEGFGLLDADNRTRVAREIVSGLLTSGRRKQVVVITHMDDIQAAFSARYHLVHNGHFTQLYDGDGDGVA